MNLLSLDEFSQKLRTLIRSKYRKNTDFYKEYHDTKDKDIEKVCKQWLKGNNYPNIDSAIDLCNFFGCDLEYLFTEQESFSRNIDETAKIMGLQYSTIEELKNLPSAEKHIIDSICNKSANGMKLINLIKEMLYYSNPLVKNRTKIILDKGITTRDSSYSDLERELNLFELNDILSNRLVIEMKQLLESLCRDQSLLDEIKTDYTQKNFYEHQKILSAEELPRLTKDGGLDIEHDIERLENKILKRLLNREKDGKFFQYNYPNLSTSSDFSKITQGYRNKKNPMTPTEYHLILKEIDQATE